MSDWCLITDIDGTLVGESSSTKRLRRVLLEARAELEARGRRLYWAIATGRRLESTQEVLLEEGFQLGDFQALVTSVGAEIYHANQSAPSRAYFDALDRTGFERRAVLEALAPLEFLRLQPDEDQFAHKVAYFMSDTVEHRARIHAALATLPFPSSTVISHDEYLDVVPVNGAKGGAVAHLLDLWQIPRARAVAAGDSGNDENMLEQDWHGIVVGNGRKQLAHLSPRPNVYFASKKHAAGILEGLLALGFLSEES